MLRTQTLLLSLSLVAVALAGCTGGDAPVDTTTPATTTTTPATTTPTTTPPVTPTPNETNGTTSFDGSTFVLESLGVPTQAQPGKVNFTLFVNGSKTAASDHVGAHYALNSTTNPPGVGRQDCEHQAGQLGGTFNVTCTFATEGTYYVWGHARVTDAAGDHDWWTALPSMIKVRTYNLTLANVPTSPVGSKSNFTFTLQVNGTDNATSDHIGAHFWNATEANPTVENSAGACAHTAGGAVGNHTVTCSIESAGITPKEFYVRGHLRLVEGSTTLHWWSSESKVTVSPIGLGGLPG